MGVGRHVEYLSVSSHELHCKKVVGGEAVLRHQPAQATTERQPRDAGRRDGASGHGETVLGVRGVEFRPRHPAFGPDRPGLGVGDGVLHLRQVDQHRVVCDAPSGDVVASAADSDVETALTCEANSCRGVSCVAAANYDRRLAVDQRVVNLARLVVPLVARGQHAAGDPAQRLHIDTHGADSRGPLSRVPATRRASRGGRGHARATTSCLRRRTRGAARAQRAPSSPSPRSPSGSRHGRPRRSCASRRGSSSQASSRRSARQADAPAHCCRRSRSGSPADRAGPPRARGSGTSLLEQLPAALAVEALSELLELLALATEACAEHRAASRQVVERRHLDG